MFDEPSKLLLGLVTGMMFGFFLQKGRVAKFSVIVGQLLLRDATVAKIMLTAVAAGSIGVYALVSLGMASLHVKPAVFGPVLIGAALFGGGLALFGYCPGTGVAACGEGRRDAMVGVGGMFAGALAYVWFYPALLPVLTTGPDWGDITLPGLTYTSPWLWNSALGIAAVTVFLWLDRSRRRPRAARLK